MDSSRQRKEIEAASFYCVSKLATAVGQALTKHMHDLLDLMFNCGLSEPLVQALSNISERIKPLSRTIQGMTHLNWKHDWINANTLIHRASFECDFYYTMWTAIQTAWSTYQSQHHANS